MKKINKALALLGVELVKGEGYFYMVGLTTNHDISYATESIVPCMVRLSDYSVEELIGHAARQIEEGKSRR